MPEPLEVLGTAYGDLAALLSALTAPEQWCPTGCAGWTPVDDRDLWATRVSASVTGGLPAISVPYTETTAAVLVSAVAPVRGSRRACEA